MCSQNRCVNTISNDTNMLTSTRSQNTNNATQPSISIWSVLPKFHQLKHSTSITSSLWLWRWSHVSDTCLIFTKNNHSRRLWCFTPKVIEPSATVIKQLSTAKHKWGAGETQCRQITMTQVAASTWTVAVRESVFGAIYYVWGPCWQRVWAQQSMKKDHLSYEAQVNHHHSSSSSMHLLCGHHEDNITTRAMVTGQVCTPACSPVNYIKRAMPITRQSKLVCRVSIPPGKQRAWKNGELLLNHHNPGSKPTDCDLKIIYSDSHKSVVASSAISNQTDTMRGHEIGQIVTQQVKKNNVIK